MIEIDTEKINRINFRNCLDAMSHPGKIYPVTPLFDSGLLAVASVLLYSEVTYHYQGALNFQVVAALTGAGRSSIECADYLFSDRPDRNALQKAKAGTAESPEDSAILLFQCNDLTTGTQVILSGPGIDGSFTTRLPMQADFIEHFQEKNSSFPNGVDLFLIDMANRIVGLPRTVHIEVIA
jgi:alpha-D-ribose 1-methylphosphonate 5-triphosphate synthase subunit PhnH